MSGLWHELRSRWLVPAGVFAVVVVIDQLTKAWIVRELGPVTMTKAITVVFEWARLVYHHNTGIAFGMFQGIPQLFSVTSLLISAAALFFYRTQLPHHNPWVQVAIGLIVGGAIGNAIDRIRLGYVVDFISIGWFAIFNVADSAITVGVALLALTMLLIGDGQDRPAQPQDESLLGELLSREARD